MTASTVKVVIQNTEIYTLNILTIITTSIVTQYTTFQLFEFLVYTVWACLKAVTPYNTLKEESTNKNYFDDYYSAPFACRSFALKHWDLHFWTFLKRQLTIGSLECISSNIFIPKVGSLSLNRAYDSVVKIWLLWRWKYTIQCSVTSVNPLKKNRKNKQ